MAFPLTRNAILSFRQLFAADALQTMALLLITYARNATVFKRVRNEVFRDVKCDMNVFKLLRTLRAKITPHLPNILSDVTSIQDSNSECKDKTFRNALSFWHRSFTFKF